LGLNLLSVFDYHQPENLTSQSTREIFVHRAYAGGFCWPA
jgi:hypothetical protein